LSGAALGLATMKPQMSYLIVPFILLWALREGKWRLIGSFAAVFGALIATAFILQPTWVSDWLFELGRYTDYTAVGSPAWVVTQHYLGLGAVGEWAVNFVFYGIVLWAWFGVLVGRNQSRWLWTVMLTLSVTHLVAPRTATTHFVVLLMPLLFYIATLSKGRRGLWAALILLALLILPWWHTVSTINGEFEHPATYLPLPFGMALLLIVTRPWWVSASQLQMETAQ